jgi:hypothetical protein
MYFKAWTQYKAPEWLLKINRFASDMTQQFNKLSKCTAKSSHRFQFIYLFHYHPCSETCNDIFKNINLAQCMTINSLHTYMVIITIIMIVCLTHNFLAELLNKIVVPRILHYVNIWGFIASLSYPIL